MEHHPATDDSYTVSALSDALRGTVEAAYSTVRVRGEVSGLTRAASGHIYFTLKDERATLDAVCWRGNASSLGDMLQDGAELRCGGKLTTYAGRSKYQLIVSSAEPAGQGALMALLEQRKKKLQAEGLFDATLKRPLPFLPQVIGVITSPTGAVIRDILHRVQDRFPRPVLIWPVAVQGAQAEAHLLAAFASVRKLYHDHAAADDGTGPRPLAPLPDVIILARGGGSVEDLWTFNSEDVARAVRACPIPVITAIGHETDTTLVDYVADRRAPTPTGAAEIALPHRNDLITRIDDNEERARAVFRAYVHRRTDGLAQVSAAVTHGKERYFSRLKQHPERLLNGAQRRFSHLLKQCNARLWRVPQAKDRLQRYMSGQRRRLERRTDAVSHTAGRYMQQRRSCLERVPGTRAALMTPLARRKETLQRIDITLRLRTDYYVNVRRHAFAKRAERISARLIPLAAARRHIDTLTTALPAARTHYIRDQRARLTQAERVLKQCSHKAILDKGYAVVRQGGTVITRASAFAPELPAELEFTDGVIRS